MNLADCLLAFILIDGPFRVQSSASLGSLLGGGHVPQGGECGSAGEPVAVTSPCAGAGQEVGDTGAHPSAGSRPLCAFPPTRQWAWLGMPYYPLLTALVLLAMLAATWHHGRRLRTRRVVGTRGRGLMPSVRHITDFENARVNPIGGGDASHRSVSSTVSSSASGGTSASDAAATTTTSTGSSALGSGNGAVPSSASGTSSGESGRSPAAGESASACTKPVATESGGGCSRLLRTGVSQQQPLWLRQGGALEGLTRVQRGAGSATAAGLGERARSRRPDDEGESGEKRGGSVASAAAAGCGAGDACRRVLSYRSRIHVRCLSVKVYDHPGTFEEYSQRLLDAAPALLDQSSAHNNSGRDAQGAPRGSIGVNQHSNNLVETVGRRRDGVGNLDQRSSNVVRGGDGAASAFVTLTSVCVRGCVQLIIWTRGLKQPRTAFGGVSAHSLPAAAAGGPFVARPQAAATSASTLAARCEQWCTASLQDDGGDHRNGYVAAHMNPPLLAASCQQPSASSMIPLALPYSSEIRRWSVQDGLFNGSSGAANPFEAASGGESGDPWVCTGVRATATAAVQLVQLAPPALPLRRYHTYLEAYTDSDTDPGACHGTAGPPPLPPPPLTTTNREQTRARTWGKAPLMSPPAQPGPSNIVRLWVDSPVPQRARLLVLCAGSNSTSRSHGCSRCSRCSARDSGDDGCGGDLAGAAAADAAGTDPLAELHVWLTGGPQVLELDAEPWLKTWHPEIPGGRRVCDDATMDAGGLQGGGPERSPPPPLPPIPHSGTTSNRNSLAAINLVLMSPEHDHGGSGDGGGGGGDGSGADSVAEGEAAAFAATLPQGLPCPLVHLVVPLLLLPAAAATEVGDLWKELRREAMDLATGGDAHPAGEGAEPVGSPGSGEPLSTPASTSTGLSATAAAVLAESWKNDFQPFLDDLAFMAEATMQMAAAPSVHSTEARSIYADADVALAVEEVVRGMLPFLSQMRMPATAALVGGLARATLSTAPSGATDESATLAMDAEALRPRQVLPAPVSPDSCASGRPRTACGNHPTTGRSNHEGGAAGGGEEPARGAFTSADTCSSLRCRTQQQPAAAGPVPTVSSEAAGCAAGASFVDPWTTFWQRWPGLLPQAPVGCFRPPALERRFRAWRAAALARAAPARMIFLALPLLVGSLRTLTSGELHAHRKIIGGVPFCMSDGLGHVALLAYLRLCEPRCRHRDRHRGGGGSGIAVLSKLQGNVQDEEALAAAKAARLRTALTVYDAVAVLAAPLVYGIGALCLVKGYSLPNDGFVGNVSTAAYVVAFRALLQPLIVQLCAREALLAGLLYMYGEASLLTVVLPQLGAVGLAVTVACMRLGNLALAAELERRARQRFLRQEGLLPVGRR